MELHDIAGALQVELAAHFQTVRLSAVQTPEQFLSELKALNPDKLPGVLIVLDNFTLNSGEGIEEYRFTLVVVDRFVAGSDDRALSVFRSGATLLRLFPGSGRAIGGVFCHPLDCVAASPGGNYAALALGIVCKQGF